VTETSDHQAGYLLHYTQYGDANFIVDFFSLNLGRISMIAKGARSSQPRTRALYQPFRPLLVSWWGDQNLRTLTGIEESGPSLPLDGKALPCGYYLNEILLRLLPKEQPMPTLFAHYALALSELVAAPNKPEPILRQFELQLLDNLGLLPDFSQCEYEGNEIVAEASYDFYLSSLKAIIRPEDSLIAIPKKPPPRIVYHDDGETIDPGIRISGRALIALAEFDIDHDDVLADIKPLMRSLLRVHLGEKPLNSRELFSSLTPPPPPPAKKTEVFAESEPNDGLAVSAETASAETTSLDTAQSNESSEP